MAPVNYPEEDGDRRRMCYLRGEMIQSHFIWIDTRIHCLRFDCAIVATTPIIGATTIIINVK